MLQKVVSGHKHNNRHNQMGSKETAGSLFVSQPTFGDWMSVNGVNLTGQGTPCPLNGAHMSS